MVLSAVDKRLQAEFPNMRGFRYFDDYEAAFATQSEAAESLACLEGLLAEFELSLNPTKTMIRELPAPLDITWSRELTRHELRTATSAKTKKDLIDLFSRAAELAAQNPGSLKYALRRTQHTILRTGDWPTYQNLVWSVVSSEPTTMSLGLDLLVSKAHQLKAPIDLDAALSVVESMIASHAPLRNGSEVVWALWTSVYLKLDLSARAAALCSQMDDNFVALVALHAESEGRFPSGALDTTRWEVAVSQPKALKGPNWLLAYEAGRRKWLSGSSAQITSDQFFSQLASSKVAFYDTDPSWTPFSGPSAPLPGGPFPDEYL